MVSWHGGELAVALSTDFIPWIPPSFSLAYLKVPVHKDLGLWLFPQQAHALHCPPDCVRIPRIGAVYVCTWFGGAVRDVKLTIGMLSVYGLSHNIGSLGNLGVML